MPPYFRRVKVINSYGMPFRIFSLLQYLLFSVVNSAFAFTFLRYNFHLFMWDSCFLMGWKWLTHG